MVAKGAPLLNRALFCWIIPKREIPNFTGTIITKELPKGILTASLKYIGVIPLLNYTVIWQRVSNGGPPRRLNIPPPIAVAHSKREISNFAGMSLTRELTE